MKSCFKSNYQLEEGKKQTNAANLKQARAKKEAGNAEVLKTCGEFIQQKDEMWLLVEAEQHNSCILQEERERPAQECEQVNSNSSFLQKQVETLTAQLGLM